MAKKQKKSKAKDLVVPEAPPREPWTWRSLLQWEFGAALAIAIAAACVYTNLLDAGFLAWDDDYNITKNPYYALGRWQRLWSETYYGMYIPVTSTVWAFLFKAGEGDAMPFRIFNLVLHGLNVGIVAMLLRGLLQRLRIETKTAWLFGVAVFAFHPLQVGTVAWISGGRDLLASFFGLLAVLVYFARGQSWKALVPASLLFVAGLMCKPHIAAFPVALSAFVFFFEREKLWATVKHMSIWCLLAVGAAMITFGTQKKAMEFHLELWERPVVMLDAFGFYIRKTLLPFDLSTDYGRKPHKIWENTTELTISIATTLVTLALGTWLAWRNRKYAFAALWFVLLLPVSGIVLFAFQEISTVADHYNYLPLIIVSGLAALVMHDLSRATSKLFAEAKAGEVTVGALVVLFSAVAGWASFDRAETWRSDITFFTEMARLNDHSYSAMIGLGTNYCADPERIGEGYEWIRKAMQERPNEPVSTANAGYCLFKMKRFKEVVKLEENFQDPKFVERSLRHDVAVASLLSSIGSAYYVLGNSDRGFLYLCQGHYYNPIEATIKHNVDYAKIERRKAGENDQCPPHMALQQIFATGQNRMPAENTR